MSRQEAVSYSSNLAAYVELAKPRIVTLVLVTGAIGYLLGAGSFEPFGLFLSTICGIALTAAGAGALNHFFEGDIDALMDRTRNRPIPSGQIVPWHALAFGVYTTLGGLVLLLVNVNLLTAFLALLTTFLYVVVYTPMKRWSWANTLVGAVPGALPPMGGWAAATGQLGMGAWILFLIMFLWQQPHFYAIAWMFREDYRKGGLKMLPVVEPDGRSTFRQVLLNCAVLVPASMLPWAVGLTGPVYLIGALLLGGLFMYRGVQMAREGTHQSARGVLKASVVYLPVLLGLILLDFWL
jgi:protoheme IX farnesyltransferase